MISVLSSFLLAFLVSVPDPSSTTLVDEVDLIEINHYMDKKNHVIFSQFLFWNDGPKNEMQLLAWRLRKNEHRPIWRSTSERYILIWVDEINTGHGVLRKVKSKRFRETWSRTDPERENIIIIPEDKRIGLKETREPQ